MYEPLTEENQESMVFWQQSKESFKKIGKHARDWGQLSQKLLMGQVIGRLRIYNSI